MADASKTERISKELLGSALETEPLPGDEQSNTLGCCYKILPSRCSWNCSNGLYRNGHKDSLRNSPKGWQTTPYILGNEVTERIASFGLTWSMIIYLTQQYHLSKVSASYFVTVTTGITSLAPLFGGFVADAYLGRYRAILCGSLSNLVGMVWLSLSAILPTLRPAPCSGDEPGIKNCSPASQSQVGFLYMAFLFLAIGSGGIRPCSYPFGADQFGQTTTDEKKQLQSFFNLYYFAMVMAMLLAVTMLAYIQLDVSWGLGFGLSAALMAIAIVAFLSGFSKYRHVPLTGSPFTDVAKVLVAAYRKRNVALPSDPSELYFGEDQEVGEQTCAKDQIMLGHTDQFRWLDKAAVMRSQGVDGDAEGRPRAAEGSWRLSEVHKVEQVKCVARVMTIWVSGIMASTNLAVHTIFVPLQAQAMDRRLTRNSSFQIPPSSMAVVAFLSIITWLPIYDRVLVPLARKFSRDPVRGISLFQRIASGYLLAVLGLLLAGLVEFRRRSSPSKLSVLWLVPQLILFGISDAFYIIGIIEFFYEQMPPRMRSVAGALFSCTIGLGSFLGGILLAIVQTVTGRPGHRKWVAENLSDGHVDYFYYLLAVILALNCIYFFVCASYYKPSRLQPAADRTSQNKADLVGTDTAMSDHFVKNSDRRVISKESTPQLKKMQDVEGGSTLS